VAHNYVLKVRGRK